MVAAAVGTWAILTSSAPARAADILWGNPDVGDYGDPNNWFGTAVPGPADQADVSDGGTATISTGETFTNTEVWAGNDVNAFAGKIQQTGGTLNVSQWLVVGRAGSVGVYDMTGGVVNQQGTSVQLAGSIGQVDSAVMRLSGNALMNTSGAAFDVGDAGYGHLYIQDQATIKANGNEFWIGENTGATGIVDMSGGTINSSNWFVVGRQGATGTLNLTGGVINHAAVNHITIGSLGGNGTVNQTGGTFNSSGSDIYIGEVGTGVYNLGGGTLSAATTWVGVNNGATGTLNMTGGVLTTTGFQSAAGAIPTVILNGGTVRAAAANAGFFGNLSSGNISIGSNGFGFDANGFAVTINKNLAGPGGFTMQGSSGSLTLSASNAFAGNVTVNGGTLVAGVVGSLGNGSGVVLNGGALAINADAEVAGKLLTFAGGALQFQNYNSSLGFANLPQLKLGAALGTASGLSGAITGNTRLTYVGPGTLNLSNPSNTYTGGTNISAGTINAVVGSLGSGGILLSGTGTLGIGSDAAVAGLPLTFAGGGLTFNNYTSNLSFSPGLNITLGAASGAASTLTGSITNNGSNPSSVTYVGPGTLNLTGSNNYSGATNVTAGVLNVAATSNLGNGPINISGGSTLSVATFAGLGSGPSLNIGGGSTLILPGNGDLGAGRTVTLGAGATTINTTSGSVTVTGGLPLASGVTLAGAFTKSGPGSLTLTGPLRPSNVFVRGGTLVLAGTSAANTASGTANDYSSIGQVTGDVGAMVVQDNASFIAAGDLNVGDVALTTGSLSISGNASVQVRTFYVAKSNGSSGTVVQTGGSLAQANNGTAGGDWRFGGSGGTADATATAVYNMSAGSFSTPSNFQVGAFGSGTFIESGGVANVGTVVATPGTGGGFLSVGRFATGTGVWDMSSGNATLNASSASYTIFGEQGNGTLKLGGTSVVNASTLSLGHANGGKGTVIQTGGTLNAPGGVVMGTTATGAAGTTNATSGVYTLSGGTLNTSSVSRALQTNVTGTFNFNGGTLQSTTNGTNLVNNLTAANVMAGGAIINTNGNSVSLGQALQHDPTVGAPAVDGGLTKNGAGVLTVGASSTYTGATVINGGTLRVGSSTVNAVAHYSFDAVAGNTVINDGTGGATDNGTLTGGATIVAGGKFGNAVASNASGGGVTINAPIEDLSGSGTWSVSAWIKTTLAGSTIFYKGTGIWGPNQTVYYLGNGATAAGTPQIVRYGGGFGGGGGPAINDGTWHLATVVDSAGTKTYYTDGVATTPAQAGFTTAADVTGSGIQVKLGITADPGDGTANLIGALDEVGFYSSALTPTQVGQLFATNVLGGATATTNLLPSTTAVQIPVAGATLDLNGNNQTIASLSGIGGSSVTLGTGALTVGDATSTTFAGAITGTGGLTKVGTGTLTLGATPSGNAATGIVVRTFGTLNVSAGSLALAPSLTSATRQLLITPSLTLAGKLDLGNGDLLVHNGTLATLNAAAAAGFSGGTWNGSTGLASSAAAADAKHLTALGVIQNVDTGGVNPLFTTFDGQPVVASDVLARYTYYGDTNLDGSVTAADYTRIDAGFLMALTGWANGDFNYDGVVDGSDYSLMDNAFNQQTGTVNPALAVASPAALVASPTAELAGGTAAVPEPTTLALLGVGGTALLARRRRRIAR